MRSVTIDLLDLVQQHGATHADWEYVNNDDHVTPGVMRWRVTLYNVSRRTTWDPWSNSRTLVIPLANGTHLDVSAYVTKQVIERMNR